MIAPDVSVIIRCFNEEAHIGRLMQGILAQKKLTIEIIVVDSGSTDHTLGIVEQFPARLVHISPDEFSFGRSLNRGCAQASGRFLVFASAHVYPIFDNWLERLIAPFADEKVALSYGMQRGCEVTKFSEHQIFRTWFPEASVANQQHPFCNNANAAVRAECWQEQPFDESLTGLEDIAWAKAAQRRGYRIAYAADAPVTHVHDESYRQIFNRYRREAIAYASIIDDHRFSVFHLAQLVFVNVLADYLQAARSDKFWESLVSIPAFRASQFYGTFTGTRHRGKVSKELMRRMYYPALEGVGPSPSAAASGTRIDYSDHLSIKQVRETL